jgi:hypothetical protein
VGNVLGLHEGWILPIDDGRERTIGGMDGRRLGFPTALVAVGGVLTGHWLTYLIVRPDHHGRATTLASTGHGYLAAAVELAWLLALVAAAAVFLDRLTGRGDAPLRSAFRPLVALQLAAFVTLEVVERAMAGSFEGLVVVCVVGAGMQLIVAATSTWILRIIAQAADPIAVVRGAAPTVFRRAVAPIAWAAGSPHATPASLRAGIRGPPSSR